MNIPAGCTSMGWYGRPKRWKPMAKPLKHARLSEKP